MTISRLKQRFGRCCADVFPSALILCAVFIGILPAARPVYAASVTTAAAAPSTQAKSASQSKASKAVQSSKTKQQASKTTISTKKLSTKSLSTKKSAKKNSTKGGKKGGSKTYAQGKSSAAPVAAKPLFNAAPITGPSFTTARASLTVTVNGEHIPYQRFFTTVMPGKPLAIHVAGTEKYQVTADGQAINGDTNQWVWQAPNKPGYHQVQVIEELTHKTLTLHVFVLSALKNGSDAIAGFTIGRYPPPKDGKAQYNAPLGFIEVNATNQNLYISPHFQLGQFICRQKDGLPQYIALEPDLLEKLEWLLEGVNKRGTRLDTFDVMSGFRTPFYNRAIRNVVHSRHIYGSAADVFIDVKPRDGIMDDLNRDGRYDKKDAEVLYNLADAISDAHPHLAGGVGQYSGNGAHGPFVHVDVRGFDARWGANK